MNNQEHIEYLKEEIRRGESSLDTAIKVHAILKDTFPKELKEFNIAYEQHSDDGEGINEEQMERVYEAMANSPQWSPQDRNAGVNDILNSLP